MGKYSASDWTRRRIDKENQIEDVARKLFLSGQSKEAVKETCDKLWKLSFYQILEFKSNI